MVIPQRNVNQKPYSLNILPNSLILSVKWGYDRISPLKRAVVHAKELVASTTSR